MKRKRLLIPLVAVPLLLLIIGLIWWAQKGSFTIDAKIVYNLGGPQPVARQTFYLLDTDALSLTGDDPKYRATMNQLEGDAKTEIQLAAVLYLMFQKSLKEGFDEEKGKALIPGWVRSKSFWEGHIVQTAQTDFNGHAEFSGIRPGVYWLTGMAETRAAFAFWNLKLEIGRGQGNLILDQNNAVYSK